ncbi:MAG TPA: hypothetical protein VGG75_42620 [Trebonia sp.]
MAAAPSSTATAPSPAGSPDTQAGTAAGQQTPAAPSVVPFLRGSGKGKYKFFSKAGLTLTTASQDLGPIDIKAYDYMRSILVTLTTTTAGTATAGTLAADGPFNAFTNIAVKQPNGQTMYQTSSGHHSAMIQKHGYYRAHSDPRADPVFVWSSGSGTAPTMTFAFRIPFELDLRDALGSLPNKDAAAPFSLELSLNTLANVFPVSTTSPTFTVEAWLEAYDQPPTSLNGEQVQTTPPNMNTLQRWTEQNITMASGSFDARVRKLGNYVRGIIPILLNSSGVRDDSDWSDPVQIVLDEDVKDNISKADWYRRNWEIYGYGAAGSTVDEYTGGLSGRDTGVYPYGYFVDGRSPEENANLYLPTIESEDYLLRGQNWGSGASKISCLVCEVLPQGDIFS